MKKENFKLWDNITFKTKGYHKNFDLINNDESFITEYDGNISEIRIKEKKPPIPVGEYGLSVWNISLGEIFGVDFYELLKEYVVEDTYEELLNIIEKNEFNLRGYKKVVLVHSLVLKKEYRKKELVEEFIEMLHSDFHSDDVAILMLVKPFQDNTIDADYYMHRKQVEVRNVMQSKNGVMHQAFDYYSLDEMVEKDDREINEYKLFAIANRCGFQRINESYLFIFSPEKTIERMKKKRKYIQRTDNQ